MESSLVLLCFGEFSLDEDRRQLLRGSAPVPLEPKAYELLSLLLGRRPRALSKAQIRDVLWPSTAISDTVLAGVVADARSALGDDAREPRFIRTLHGFGYAFCGTVEGGGAEERARAGASAGLVWAGEEFVLTEGEHLIGRDEECLVRSRSARVSRRHARIAIHGARAVLEDLGSRNGTTVAGRRIDGPVELRSGDLIVVGPERIVFLGPGEAGTTVTDGR